MTSYDTEDIKNDSPSSKRKRRASGALRVAGIGCGTIMVLIAVGFAFLSYSQALAGSDKPHDGLPSWSPDGKQITFTSHRFGNADVFAIDADGAHLTQLTRDPFADLYLTGSAEDQQSDWAPDGKHIVFVSGRANNMMTFVNHDIYVMDSNGGSVHQLTNDGADEHGPKWSPDGSKILFAREEHFNDAGLIENPTWDLYLMNADGSNQIQLTSDAANELEAAWSPDGKQIIFVSDRSGTNADLYLMNADGSGTKQITNTAWNEFGPSFAPDGKHIAFNADPKGKVQIFVMSLDGSYFKELSNAASDSAYAVWSRDGKKIAFESDRKDGVAYIFVMDADGSDVTEVTGP